MRNWFYDFSKCVLWIFFRLGFGLEVRGQKHVPKRGGVILASNHVSFLDPPVLGAACPRRLGFMAKKSLFRHPLLGAFMRGVHVIPLQREERDLGAIREAVSRLRRGEAVAIFPEGGRQLDGKLGNVKRGVGLLATAARVPIVPVLVHGTFEALPPQGGLHRAKIHVAFGPAISYTTTLSSASEGHTTGPDGRAGRAGHEQMAEALAREWSRLLEEQRRGPPHRQPGRQPSGST